MSRWPPRSGRIRRFPEVDDARWQTVPEATPRLVRGQRPILDALRVHLDDVGRRYRVR